MTRRKFENHKANQVNPSLVIRTRLHLETDYSRKKPDIYLERVSDIGTKGASNANSFRYIVIQLPRDFPIHPMAVIFTRNNKITEPKKIPETKRNAICSKEHCN